jgi:hypothetical protein
VTRSCSGRDAFKALLRKHAEQSIIQAASRWQRYREVVRKEPEFLSLVANTSGSRPKELFLDEVQALSEAFSKDKVMLKRVLAEHEFVITAETEWEDFLAFLQTHDVGCASRIPAWRPGYSMICWVSTGLVRTCLNDCWVSTGRYAMESTPSADPLEPLAAKLCVR